MTSEKPHPRSSEVGDAWTGPRLVLGIQPVREALRARGAQVARVLVDRRGGPTVDALARFASSVGVTAVERVPVADLDRLARGTRHQGVAAWAPPLVRLPLEALLLEPHLLGVALDGITDPQNFGAVVRGAVVLGGAAVLWQHSRSAPISPATLRASAGAIEHARLCQVPSLRGALEEAAAQGIQVVGLAPDAPLELAEVNLTGPTLLVTGSEGEGMSRGVRRTCTALARLCPMHGVDSLNASVATAIALYEAVRQRAVAPPAVPLSIPQNSLPSGTD